MLPVVVATLASLGHRDSMVTHTTAGQVMDSVEVLYNNDGENLWAVQSPYHDRATAVTESDIRGSVNDVAGVADVDLICPFHNVYVGTFARASETASILIHARMHSGPGGIPNWSHHLPIVTGMTRRLISHGEVVRLWHTIDSMGALTCCFSIDCRWLSA